MCCFGRFRKRKRVRVIRSLLLFAPRTSKQHICNDNIPNLCRISSRLPMLTTVQQLASLLLVISIGELIYVKPPCIGEKFQGEFHPAFGPGGNSPIDFDSRWENLRFQTYFNNDYFLIVFMVQGPLKPQKFSPAAHFKVHTQLFNR